MVSPYIKYSSTEKGIHEINVNLNLVVSSFSEEKTEPYPKTNKQALIRLRDVIIDQIRNIGGN